MSKQSNELLAKAEELEKKKKGTIKGLDTNTLKVEKISMCGPNKRIKK